MLQIKRMLLYIPIMVLLASCQARKGCTDAASANFQEDARIDDGSCQYRTVYLNMQRLTKLDNIFKETSGLAYDGTRLWTIDDSGGENKIYSINLVNGRLLEEIVIENGINIDYEALIYKDGYFYVGDIGNNRGERQELTIYKFRHPEQVNRLNSVVAEVITYSYSDRKNVIITSETEYDAEAMIVMQGNIFIFTKNHREPETKLYVIPDRAGHHEAIPLGVFRTEGMVTAAALDEAKKRILLLGHDRLRTFVWQLSDWKSDRLFSGKKLKVDTGPFDEVGQVEGMCFFTNDQVFISNERNSNVDQGLYILDISSLK